MRPALRRCGRPQIRVHDCCAATPAQTACDRDRADRTRSAWRDSGPSGADRDRSGAVSAPVTRRRRCRLHADASAHAPLRHPPARWLTGAEAEC